MAHLFDTLTNAPVELSFGTSGLRGLVIDMTDLECYINTAGFLQFLRQQDNLPEASVIYIAGDLRDSTPRITRAVYQAIIDAGHTAINCGLIPTPALAFFALQNQAPCIMITGSHIPADRNGIKFYKSSGEVLKDDEMAIKAAVAEVRAAQYDMEADQSAFDAQGMLGKSPELPANDARAYDLYMQRYLDVFSGDTFAGKEIVFYQHSAVGRDMFVEMLQSLGATVTTVGRSDIFIPIDTENVTAENRAYFRQIATEHPTAFAIVSTDGDSDRPFVIDATGEFHRGDMLGTLVASRLQADFAAYTVNCNDAADTYLAERNVKCQHTKIGSPYLIVAMQEAKKTGKQRVVAWEANGGFMLSAAMPFGNGQLQALPTRDAIFPILVALLAAVQDNKSVAEVFAALPARFTQSGLINDFPSAVSREILQHFGKDTPEARQQLATYFSPELGFDEIININTLDGIRIHFNNGDIAHIRPSGNAPQLRIYSVANTQKRADYITTQALAEPNGIYRQMQQSL